MLVIQLGFGKVLVGCSLSANDAVGLCLEPLDEALPVGKEIPGRIGEPVNGAGVVIEFHNVKSLQFVIDQLTAIKDRYFS